jgi:MFS family permease
MIPTDAPAAVGAAPPAAPPPPAPPVTAEASQRNTVVLVGFTAITNLSDGVLKVALPLIATTLTDSPALVSGVFVTLMLPWILSALHVGVLVDRVDRRTLLWLANIVRMGMLAILLTAAGLDALTLPIIYGCGLILGLAEVVALTSAAALIPTAVAPVYRERANSWLTAAETVCNEFIGPFLGGLLVAAGAMFALGGTAGGYALTTVALLFLVGRFRPRVDLDKPRPSVNSQIGEALRFLWQQRVLRVMTLLVAVLCSLWGAWLGLMPLYATQDMGISAATYGLLVGALGAGGTVGSVVVGRLNRVFGRRQVMFANIPFTAAMVAFPAVSTNVWLVGLGAFLGGLGGGLWVVNARTVSQTLVETEMMGRYSAVSRMFGWGASPVGAAVAGLLAEGFGVQLAFVVFTGIALIVIVPFMRDFSPAVAADIDARLAAAAKADT